jgi:hypothetical protein
MFERRIATFTGIIAEVVAAIATVSNQWCWYPHASAFAQPVRQGDCD